MGYKIPFNMIQYVAQKFIYAIAIDDQWQNMLPSPPPTPTRPERNPLHTVDPILTPSPTPLPSLEDFMARLIQHSGAQVATLLSTLIYLQRLRERISSDVKGLLGRLLAFLYFLTMSEGMLGTRHRIFLATLIVAAKYLNDSGPKNIHWTAYAGCFDLVEVNMMETQLLDILNYDLRFDEAEACRHFASFMGRNSGQNLVRQSALLRVFKGSGAREAAAHLPLTPPSEGSSSNGTPGHSPSSYSQPFNSVSKRCSRNSSSVTL
jgi:hypothetical protein